MSSSTPATEAGPSQSTNTRGSTGTTRAGEAEASAGTTGSRAKENKTTGPKRAPRVDHDEPQDQGDTNKGSRSTVYDQATDRRWPATDKWGAPAVGSTCYHEGAASFQIPIRPHYNAQDMRVVHQQVASGALVSSTKKPIDKKKFGDSKSWWSTDWSYKDPPIREPTAEDLAKLNTWTDSHVDEAYHLHVLQFKNVSNDL